MGSSEAEHAYSEERHVLPTGLALGDQCDTGTGAEGGNGAQLRGIVGRLAAR